MSIQVSKYGEVTVLTPKDDLIGEEVDTLRHRTSQCLDEQQRNVVLDCTGVGGFDSAALEALVDFQSSCESGLGAVKLCCLDATCARILEITRLGRRFEVFDDLESAVKSFT